MHEDGLTEVAESPKAAANATAATHRERTDPEVPSRPGHERSEMRADERAQWRRSDGIGTLELRAIYIVQQVVSATAPQRDRVDLNSQLAQSNHLALDECVGNGGITTGYVRHRYAVATGDIVTHGRVHRHITPKAHLLTWRPVSRGAGRAHLPGSEDMRESLAFLWLAWVYTDGSWLTKTLSGKLRTRLQRQCDTAYPISCHNDSASVYPRGILGAPSGGVIYLEPSVWTRTARF
jgi:hypothetical protein